jgi:hypothetical protein
MIQKILLWYIAIQGREEQEPPLLVYYSIHNLFQTWMKHYNTLAIKDFQEARELANHASSDQFTTSRHL